MKQSESKSSQFMAKKDELAKRASRGKTRNELKSSGVSFLILINLTDH